MGPNWVIVCQGGGKTLAKGGLAWRPEALVVVSQSPSFKAQTTIVKTMFFKKSLKMLRNTNVCENTKEIIHQEANLTDEPKVDPLLRNIGRISSPSRFFSPTVISENT